MLDYLILNNSPFKLEENTMLFQVSSQMQLDHFTYLKPSLSNYIKKKTGILMAIDAVIQDAVEESKKLYTSSDKFAFLADKYPLLLELKKKLGLELDM